MLDTTIFPDIDTGNNVNDDLQVEEVNNDIAETGEIIDLYVPDLPDDFDSIHPLNDTDYTTYLTTIIQNQEEIIQLNKDISDNCFRLYYFIGGLYVAFAVIIGIKFFKTFLF